MTHYSKTDLSLTEIMRLEDYRVGLIDPIDAQVAREFPCEECGGQCSARGYRNPHTGGYRVFSVCEDCGNEEEF